MIYISDPLYFVTISTESRRKILANDELHAALRSFAQRGLDSKGVGVGRYVIMPDHIHLFVRGPHDFRLSVWINQLKGHLTRG